MFYYEKTGLKGGKKRLGDTKLKVVAIIQAKKKKKNDGSADRIKCTKVRYSSK